MRDLRKNRTRGRFTDPDEAYIEYPDPRRDAWTTEILPALKAMPMHELMERSGLSRRTLQMIRSGRRARPENQRDLIAIVLDYKEGRR